MWCVASFRPFLLYSLMPVPWLSIFRPFLDPNSEKMSFSTIFLTSTRNLWWPQAPARVKNLTSKNWTKKVSAQVWFALGIPVRQLITKTNVTGHVAAPDFWKFRKQRKMQFNVLMGRGGASNEQSVLENAPGKILGGFRPTESIPIVKIRKTWAKEDLFVKFKVETPKKESRKAKEPDAHVRTQDKAVNALGSRRDWIKK